MITPVHVLRLFSALLCGIFAAGLPAVSLASVIGTNVPATSLTAERVTDKPEWRRYVENSQRQRAADRRAFAAELRAHHLTTALPAPPGSSAKGIKLDNPADWYAGAEARRIADIIVSFQTPAGGWSKNLEMTKHRRAPGESFITDNRVRSMSSDDFDKPQDPSWNYVGTFDNGATTTQLRFLAKVLAAGDKNPALLNCVSRGLEYIFAAQFPNGGWPQVWPLQGGYHDEITFNDGAMLHIVKLLRDVFIGEAGFSCVPAKLRAKAETSWRRGLDCILAAQIKAGGKRTVWCQQYDALTLQPASARNYEMPSLSSGESAEVVSFLLELPQPDERVVASVHDACAWFAKNSIADKKFARVGSEPRQLVDVPGSGPIWPRFSEIGTDRPIFGDRDKTIHDNVNDISRERRNGYAWYCDTPKRVLQHYAAWAKAHPRP